MRFLIIMNAFIMALSVGIVAVLSHILWRERRAWDEPFYGAAVGIAVYSCGEALRQAWFLVWRFGAHGSPDWLHGGPIMTLYGFGALAAIGAVCKIRVFSISRYGHFAWIAVLLGAMLFAGMFWFFPVE